MKKLLLSLTLICIFSTSFLAQKWTQVDNTQFRSSNQEQRITIPKKYESYQLDIDDLKQMLENAPERFFSNEPGILITWPMPEGKFQQFRIKRSDVFHPELAAKYPDIKAFTGYSTEDPTARLKISMSHKGIEGMLLSDRHETMYLDRYLPKSESQYILYKRSDYQRDQAEEKFECHVEDPKDGFNGNYFGKARFGDCQLRKYRLALACTGEYATFHGGNIPDVLAEFNASMVRVNGIYEKDFTITMELIPETDQLIFLNGATDPYTNNNGGTMLGQNQTTIDNIIGFNNYDIGHVYSTGGGGIASLRSPCTNRKARGVTGLGNPTGDFFWVDYVSHEMGHQFGGNHTQNNPCNRNNSTAMEPGSASTIMGYAGICSPNVQNNSDDYFHAISQIEVANFVVAGDGGGCAEIIPLDNNAPVINSTSPSGLVIPGSTPFLLTADAIDPDGDVLTYCWEQMDNEVATMPPVENSSGGPTFRSLDPTESPTRYFPSLTPILFGLNGTTWEVLPSSTRELNFNLTVRDNNELGGCTADESITISTTSMAGPFLITSQNTPTTWNGGETQTITWDVANTDAAPVNCANVDILFSSDRGENFDLILAEGIPNNGQFDITVPFVFTNQGRIQVICSDNIFFDINNRDINVIAPFSTSVSPSEASLCPEEVATFTIDFTTFSADPVPVSFSVTGLPANATATFDPEQADDDTEVILTIDNIVPGDAGNYDLTILTTGEDVVGMQTVNLNIGPNQNQPVEILSPIDGQIGISVDALLSWQAVPGVNEYELQLSKNPDFSTLIESTTISNTTFLEVANLEASTVYYWRVRSISTCVDTEWFNFQSFQTRGLSCVVDTSEASVIIPDDVVGSVESTINVASTGALAGIEVSVEIIHNYIGDLSATLRSPEGLEVELFDRPGVPQSDFGCSGDNIDVIFDTSADNTAEDFENSCDAIPPSISGVFQPLESFNLFTGGPREGVWTLTVSDAFEDDGGEIASWAISTCEPIAIDPGVVLTNNPLQLFNEMEKTITLMHLQVENSDPASTFFTLRSTPQHGTIQILDEDIGMYMDIEIGGRFTQEDIDMDRVKYVLTTIETNTDSFIFDTEDDQSRYTSNNTFLINTSIEALSITAEVVQEISCFGETDGSIQAIGSGGFPDYTYSINGSPFDSNSLYENLGPGSYTISIMDTNGDIAETNEIVLVEPTEVSFTTTIGNFEITIDAEGGTDPYLYSLDGINYIEENSFELEDGVTYTLYVQDSNGCITTSNEFTYYQVTDFSTNITPVYCKGDATGGIEILDVLGGLAPYTYQLNGSAPTSDNNFTGLSAGEYEIIVNGDSGSFISRIVTVTEPEFALTLSSTVEGNTITLDASGGNGDYIYSINGVDFSANNVFEDLPDGEYMGYVQDQFGCEASEMSIIVNTFTSNPELDRLDLFPNPALNDVVFGSPNPIQFNYQITDVTGKLIRSGQGNTNVPISIEDLQKGMYLIRVNQDKEGRVFKMIKM